jgi:regulatory protein
MPFRAPRRLDLDALGEYALRLLAQRARSVAELRQKLGARAASQSDVDRVIARLKELRALDDRQFAEHYAETQVRSNRVGRQRVLRDLLRKQVARSVAQKAVVEAYSGADEILQVEQFILRKLRAQKPAEYLAEPKNLASMYRRLRTAGFAAGPSIRVLKRFSAQADELEGLEGSE